MDRMKIGTAMQEALNANFKGKCFASIDFFQLRSGNFFFTIQIMINFAKKIFVSIN